MKAAEQQQQPNSMDSNDSANGGSDYAYRPLTTKHRRAGSTGTTGDEEYTTDEDEFYGDETDCSGVHHSHLILKSDLARATTDLFGYNEKRGAEEDEPTGLFDEDDYKSRSKSSADAISIYTYNENLVPALTRRQEKTADTADETKVIETRGLSSDKQEASAEEATFPEPKNKSNSTLETETSETSRKSQPSRNNWFSGNEKSRDNAEEQQRVKNEYEALQKIAAEAEKRVVTKLQEDLKKAQELLKLKDEEVSRLSRIRRDVEVELEELTASLFQEAHNMVREANMRAATSERLLEESRMKCEVLAAEVAALKTLVLTSTPAQPNPHLHPQIDGRCRNGEDTQLGLFAKKHRRSPSHFNLKYGRENSPPESPLKEQRSSLPCEKAEFSEKEWEKEKDKEREREKEEREKEKDKESRECGLEVDPRVHGEFLEWKANPSVDKNDPFVQRVFREDIDLCLDFPSKELGGKVRQAVLDGIIFIEAVSDKTKLAFPKKCALLETSRKCHYRMRLGDQENQWHCISQICRNRIIAVCDFLNYLRYVERGLVKSSVHDVYWEITRLRKEMVLARLGLMLSS